VEPPQPFARLYFFLPPLLFLMRASLFARSAAALSAFLPMCNLLLSPKFCCLYCPFYSHPSKKSRPQSKTPPKGSLTYYWCGRGDLNSHGLPHMHLPPATSPPLASPSGDGRRVASISLLRRCGRASMRRYILAFKNLLPKPDLKYFSRAIAFSLLWQAS